MEENLIKGNEQGAPNGNPEDIKKDFKGLLGGVGIFLKDLLDIRNNTDQEATKESIIADIPFKGHTSWILICSIFIASVGLNANSTAVVIGAMLISPLMGPILGMGLSLATNDIDTLRRSIKNFAVMVVLSVFTAFLFFYLFPLRDESSELLARTAPDIRDVLIAFFGGLALVIARAKKGTIASVIFGVAIATALMPPLCTVGFGLAIGNFGYATGAMYLFTINTIFIGLATFLVIKILRFPMVRYANSQRRRFIARMASIVAILVMIPAGFTFYNVFQESLFRKEAKQFISNNIAPYELPGEGRYLDNLTEIAYGQGKNGYIELVFMGSETIPDNIISTWNTQKNEYVKLRDVELKIVQGSKSAELDQMKYVNELYESKKAELLSKEEQIQVLKEAVERMSAFAAQQIPFQDISAEAKTNYENLSNLGFAYTFTTDFNKLDTIPVFTVQWEKGLSKQQKSKDTQKLTEWLRLRLKNAKIQVREDEI
ncbi:DUF389 domain-containing protein [Arenibacter certesii]|uniref:Membrane protein n=1 Tax=Arenibacter certesii TaxID=228955 RepID=A0A918INK1_9FLAO|nr:DUF389 domain-containing protein [Arenibacter certesii]GGW24077.1 membrane protein [Arenibacter certesii]